MKDDQSKIFNAASGVTDNNPPLLVLDDLHPSRVRAAPPGTLTQVANVPMSDSQRLLCAIDNSDGADKNNRIATGVDPIADRLGYK